MTDLEPRAFTTTRWSVVLAAAGAGAAPDSPDARSAMASLCRTYWYPLYAFVRRSGYGHDDAMDLTQGFFAKMLEKNDLRTVDPARGRFRSWLLGCLKHFLANEHDRATAQKRGGGKQPLSFDLDANDAQSRYRLEPAHELTPEKVFDRRWALVLIENVLSQLSEECRAGGKEKLFETVKPYLWGERNESYAQAAPSLDMTEAALKAAVHRLRKRYKDLLRLEISHTVHSAAEVDEEIRDLFAALA
jgi:RNA polymerase sigma-70 factor (ECF subfamily)